MVFPKDEKLQDAARLAIQSASAAVATLFVLAAIGNDEAFLAVISAVLVLDSSRDATIGHAAERLAGTAVGTAIGIAALLITSGGLVSTAGAMLAMGALAVLKPEWRYGLVAAAGLAVGSESQLWETARDRTVAIFAGAGVGIIAGLLIWPRSARGYAVGHLQQALATCSLLLKRSLAVALDSSDPDLSDLHAEFTDRIERATDAAGSARLDNGKDRTVLKRSIQSAERLWHALILLDRVGETKSTGGILPQDERRAADNVREYACGALDKLQDLEPAAEECIDGLDRCSAQLAEDLAKPSRSAAIGQMGLAYGLREVGRNIRELDELVPLLAA